jgi:hypothetical protein
MKKLFCFLLPFLVVSQLAAQNVGIGTNTPQQKLDVGGKLHVKDSIGIGVVNPAAPLQFANELGNRRIVLWESVRNDHQFSGFGINGSTLRYQVDVSGADHVFFSAINATSSRELMRVKGNGNVGIDNPNPIYKLDVIGDTRFFGDHIHTSNNSFGTWFYLINSSGTPSGWKFITTGTASGNPGTLWLFNDNNLSHLTIRQNGLTGIGTIDPQSRLHVIATNEETARFESASASGTLMTLKNTSPGGLDWKIRSSGSSNEHGAGNLVLEVNEFPLVYINPFGKIGINKYPNRDLDISGNLAVHGGNIYVNDNKSFRVVPYGPDNGAGILPHDDNYGGLGGTGNYWDDAYVTEIYFNDLFSVSDQRAKMNIRPLGMVLDKIQQLEPVRFDINPATHPGYKNARPEEIEIAKGTMGFTAQNLKEVFPSMVVANEETGLYMIRNYDQLLSVLVQGIKEQQSKILLLEARIKLLEK